MSKLKTLFQRANATVLYTLIVKLFKRTSNTFYIMALTVLWIFITIDLAIQWYMTRDNFIPDAFPSSTGMRQTTICFTLPILYTSIADGILVRGAQDANFGPLSLVNLLAPWQTWRCMILWNGKKWISVCFGSYWADILVCGIAFRVIEPILSSNIRINLPKLTLYVRLRGLEHNHDQQDFICECAFGRTLQYSICYNYALCHAADRFENHAGRKAQWSSEDLQTYTPDNIRLGRIIHILAAGTWYPKNCWHGTAIWRNRKGWHHGFLHSHICGIYHNTSDGMTPCHIQKIFLIPPKI